MSRESSHVDTPPEANLREVAETLVYVPTNQERKLKAKYWSRAGENPLLPVSGSMVTLSSIKQITGGSQAIEAAWKKPGFQQWFLNAEDGRAKLEYLFDLGLDALEELLLNPEPKTASAKVNAIKLLAELTGRYIKGKQGQIGGLGEAIASADKASLEALFESAGLTIAVSASKGNQEPLNVTPESKDS